ncbi:hypothetical protein GGF32_009447 [Allomyces javanicus]|nr:hypothetical protein GGF32_009447 [Allomyces javanicus]
MAHATDPDRRRLTYCELLQGALGLAHGLIDKVGLRHGDRVAIIAPNHDLYFMVDSACLFAGLVLVPMASQITAQEGARLIAETQPHAIVVHSSLYEIVREAVHLAKLPQEPRVILQWS